MNLDPKFKQSKGIARELKSHLHGQDMAQQGCQIWFFHITDFRLCTTALASAPKGSLHLRCDHRQKPTLLLCLSQSSPQHPRVLLDALVAAELPQEGSRLGWVRSEGHSPPPGCRSCSCSQGHFRSSFSLQKCSLSRQPLGFLWQTSASHSPEKQNLSV